MFQDWKTGPEELPASGRWTGPVLVEGQEEFWNAVRQVRAFREAQDLTLKEVSARWGMDVWGEGTFGFSGRRKPKRPLASEFRSLAGGKTGSGEMAVAKDEAYVIDLCDRVLGRKAVRQHCFDFLRGTTGRQLPVDAYYPDLKLVIEYRERQHSESVEFWDRKSTVSGISRGQQRALYDKRRRELLPKNGLTLVEISCADFECNSRKRLLRVQDRDEAVVRAKFVEKGVLSSCGRN